MGEIEGLPWHHAGEPLFRSPPAGFFRQDARTVARELLGFQLVSTTGGQEVVGVVVETEAYLDATDPASHAATRNPTERNRIMYSAGGIAYVYRSHGIHWCLNVVTGEEGEAQAVLIRGADVTAGEQIARKRRGGRRPIAAGPGRLSQAFGVNGELNGHDLSEPLLRLVPGWPVDNALVETSGRIGVRLAREWPLRYFVRGSRGVSRGPHHPGDRLAGPGPGPSTVE